MKAYNLGKMLVEVGVANMNADVVAVGPRDDVGNGLYSVTRVVLAVDGNVELYLSYDLAIPEPTVLYNAEPNT